jgi:D-lactate dehydrogenase
VRDPDADLVRGLGRVLSPERVLSRPLDRLGRSVDASLYRLVPQVVVRPRDLDEVRRLLAFARTHRRRLTFRTAGTSLSGQAITDDVLVELAPFWNRFEVLDDGQRIRSQPGVVGGFLNRVLAPHGRRLGPDPASIDAAMMGGIVSNNSSGMCCGVAQNSYHTLDGLVFLLADGTLVDTNRADADEGLRRDSPAVHGGLLALRDHVRGNRALSERIRTKFARKNTMGYSLHAFLDYERGVDILAHLMVGSQGTLGFLAEMTLRTVPDPPFRATGLLYFEELTEAGAAVKPLAEAGAAALEIMDATSLRSQSADRRYPFPIGDRTAALLAELRAPDASSLDTAVERALAALRGFRLLAPPEFSRDPAEREQHWRLRKGLFPLVGAMRPPGTTVIMEDVAVPVERLAEAIADLKELFERTGFPETVVFGHARDGNLHFVLTPDFSDPAAVSGYDAFMRGLSDLIVGKYDGALKAEHGSGRNMAPFVRGEWGEAAYSVMKELKRLLDPWGILNPGVMLNDDPDLHLKDLKPLPSISPLADRCIECGFCEPRCPSRFLTLSPRQRIVITREMTRLAALDGADSRARLESLAADYEYEGMATCAGDSMCQTACPVKIDTGALVKETKALRHAPSERRAAILAARGLGAVSAAARIGLSAASLLKRLPGGSRLLESASGALHDLAPGLVPRIAAELDLPSAAPRLPRLGSGNGHGSRAVYFPSCLTRVLGPEPGDVPMATAVIEVFQAVGWGLTYPSGLSGLCCGMPFLSKAYPEAARAVASRTAESLWTASREGTDAVVTDASPCASTLRELAAARLAETGRALRILDFTSLWAADVLPSQPGLPRRAGLAVLHPTCSLVKSGGLPDLLAVARAHAETVHVPAAAECCGFAGDRGFLVPELTASATRAEGAEVRRLLERRPAGLFSTCRTCEIGMTRAVGRPYRSIVHLVREALRGR